MTRKNAVWEEPHSIGCGSLRFTQQSQQNNSQEHLLTVPIQIAKIFAQSYED